MVHWHAKILSRQYVTSQWKTHLLIDCSVLKTDCQYTEKSKSNHIDGRGHARKNTHLQKKIVPSLVKLSHVRRVGFTSNHDHKFWLVQQCFRWLNTIYGSWKTHLALGLLSKSTTKNPTTVTDSICRTNGGLILIGWLEMTRYINNMGMRKKNSARNIYNCAYSQERAKNK